MQGSTVETFQVSAEPELLGEPEVPVEHVIPTGEGLTPKEARKALLGEMNHILQAKNKAVLQKYREEMEHYRQCAIHNANLKEGQEPVKMPRFPVIGMMHKTLNSRQIQQAVFMARQRGGYGSLLEAAGYRATK